MSRKVGILNGGGDCPGLNAVIAAAVKVLINEGYEVYGVIRGLEGLLNPVQTVPLNLKNVHEITSQGGTILHTTNQGRFTSKVGSGGALELPKEILDEAKSNLRSIGIDTLIVIGGDGTLGSAYQLQKAGINIIGVPKTIDNDLNSTDRTFGFSTAVNTVVEALDKLRTTADSHNRVFLVEVMGRHAGWISLYSGIAGEADIILLPEIPFSYEQILTKLRQDKQKGKNYSLIVVAEGIKTEFGQISQQTSAKRENVLGGVANHVMMKLSELSGSEFEMRTVILGHIQRGGAPNAEDRILSQQLGVAAAKSVVSGEFGIMVSVQGTGITTVPLAEAAKGLKKVPVDHELIATARDLGISFGDL